MKIPSLKNQVSTSEWQLRVDLAALYRLAALYGWSDLVFTHISARIPDTDNQFLINPYGLLFDEISASSLIRVDQNGNKLQETDLPVNPAGFTIHSCIHSARADAHCVIHTHSRAGVAVSAQKDGLLNISQQSTFIHTALSYHDYEGVALRADEQPRLVGDLGTNSFMILRNHGLLTVGATIADTFLAHYTFESACAIQLAAHNGSELISINPLIQQGVNQAMQNVTVGLGGKLVWPAMRRKLDRLDASYCA